MKLKNVLIVVKDIERSKKFYRDLFGLEMVLDNDGNTPVPDGWVKWVMPARINCFSPWSEKIWICLLTLLYGEIL